jgi:hypothetical protein
MRKVVNRLLGVVLALALIAGAAILIVEVVAKLADAQPVLVDWPSALAWARRTQWDATVVAVAGLVLLVAGLALTLLEVWPSRARRLPLDSDDPSLAAAVTRRGVVQEVKAAVTEVGGVTPRRVVVRPSRVRVRATSHFPVDGDGDAARDAVTASVDSHLDALHLSRRPRLAVSVDRRS